MIHTAKQLKDKVKNMSGGNSEVAQALIRTYFMERFLERVSVSEYRNNFILKGGMIAYTYASEAEKREFLSQLVDNVQIYEERKENGQWLKSIEFKLPIIKKEFTLSLDKDTQTETVVLLPKGEVDLKKIRVGKNYNLPKSENSRQPQCPPEKEKAIREALIYNDPIGYADLILNADCECPLYL